MDAAEKVILDCFKAARPRLLKAFGNTDSRMKQDDTVVTELDGQVETEIKAALTAFAPEIGQIGEEQGASGSHEAFWLIDPIDGTENFVRGIMGARNMVTLIDKGEVVMAVVYRFTTDDVFTARKGQGAYKNGEKLHVSTRPTRRAIVELSCPLTEQDNVDLVCAVRNLTSGYRVSGDWLLVVEGKEDAMLVYNSGGGDWDYAPRALLMQEAGATVSNIGPTLDNQAYDYTDHNMFAASPEVFAEVYPAIKASFARS